MYRHNNMCCTGDVRPTHSPGQEHEAVACRIKVSCVSEFCAIICEQWSTLRDERTV